MGLHDETNVYNSWLQQTKRRPTRCGLVARCCERLSERPRPPTFALATEIDRASDLSWRACDACGAMAMGAGLGFPVGDSAPLRFHPQPPTIVSSECLRSVWTYYNNVWVFKEHLALLWQRLSVRDAIGLTIVTFERPWCMRSAFGVTIVTSERPRFIWTYYSNVKTSETISIFTWNYYSNVWAFSMHLDLL